MGASNPCTLYIHKQDWTGTRPRLASWWVSSTMTIWCSVGTRDQWQMAGGSREIPPPFTSPVPHLTNFFSPSNSDTIMVSTPSTVHAKSRM